MTAERKEDLQPKRCDWCSRPGALVENVGPGIFRDLDWEPMAFMFVGIPVCGGCGGLGERYDSEDFKSKTKAIGDLRYQFYEAIRGGSPKQQLETIEKLDQNIKTLTDKYGTGVEGSFAEKVAEGELSKRIAYLKGLH